MTAAANTSASPLPLTLSDGTDILETPGGSRILCLADVRGQLSLLNTLAKQHNAQAIIHSGDFGFYTPDSLSRISDKTLTHLLQHCPALDSSSREELLNNPNPKAQLRNNFVLSQFPKLLDGSLTLDVPVYAVAGACEDVQVLESVRVAQPSQYEIHNLHFLSESSSRLLILPGLRLRLFGLGGAHVPHKLFDNGAGRATIAGGQGTVWHTLLQIGELVDTAQRVYDPRDTRLLVTHASPGRDPALAQLALVIQADLSLSAALHFRYPVSYNDFAVYPSLDTFRHKFLDSRNTFHHLYNSVRAEVDQVIDPQQRSLLNNALAVFNRLPSDQAEETAWKSTWHWNLPDAAFGSLLFDVDQGRVSVEMKSQGFNFTYRQKDAPSNENPPKGPTPVNNNSNNNNTNIEIPKKPQPPKQVPQQQQQQQPSGITKPSLTSPSSPPSGPKSSDPQRRPSPRSQQQHQHKQSSSSSRGIPERPSSAASSAHGGPKRHQQHHQQNTRTASRDDSKRPKPSTSAPENNDAKESKDATTAATDNDGNTNAKSGEDEAGMDSESKVNSWKKTSEEATSPTSQQHHHFPGGRGGGRGRGRGGRGRGDSRGGRGGHQQSQHQRGQSGGDSTPQTAPSDDKSKPATNNNSNKVEQQQKEKDSSSATSPATTTTKDSKDNKDSKDAKDSTKDSKDSGSASNTKSKDNITKDNAETNNSNKSINNSATKKPDSSEKSEKLSDSSTTPATTDPKPTDSSKADSKAESENKS